MTAPGVMYASSSPVISRETAGWSPSGHVNCVSGCTGSSLEGDEGIADGGVLGSGEALPQPASGTTTPPATRRTIIDGIAGRLMRSSSTSASNT